MSFSLWMINTLFKAAGVQKLYDRPADEINEMHRKKNAKCTFMIPDSRVFAVSQLKIDGREVLWLKQKPDGAKRALLYLYGGGFTSEFSDLEKKFAVKLGKASGRDVWIPRYPNGMDHSVPAIYGMALDTYAEMLKIYAPEDIAVVGSSAGATIAIAMFELNNTLPQPLPPAGLLIPLSPASMPVTEEELGKVKELAELDIMIPASFVDSVGETMTHGENLPEYMTKLTLGDLHHMPRTHIYYGTWETLSAAALPLQEAFRRDGSECTLHWGEKLFHCYPVMDFIPEAKHSYEEIVGLLK